MKLPDEMVKQWLGREGRNEDDFLESIQQLDFSKIYLCLNYYYHAPKSYLKPVFLGLFVMK
jgi:hypothetical protein